jgi:hypothetical protein
MTHMGQISRNAARIASASEAMSHLANDLEVMVEHFRV